MMNEKTTIGFIGGGRITGLLLAAFKHAGEWPAENETIIVAAFRSKLNTVYQKIKL